MPELPDVEGFRRYLARTALQQPIKEAVVHTQKSLHGITPLQFEARLAGQRLTGTQRHGKWLLAELDNRGALALHFGMTAFLRYHRTGTAEHRHDRVTLRFTNGAQLAFNDQRLFGRVSVVDDAKRFIRQQRLGPDALTVTRKQFREVAGKRRGSLKAFLMDQRAHAGIGNLYADEILFQARLHPLARTDRLSEHMIQTLYRIMRRVLRTAIRRNADSKRFPQAWLFRHRVKAGTCPRCGGPLRHIRAGQRTTIFCPRCQRWSGASMG
jgi:formamidopyrimidine-DNA glycosylase